MGRRRPGFIPPVKRFCHAIGCEQGYFKGDSPYCPRHQRTVARFGSMECTTPGCEMQSEWHGKCRNHRIFMPGEKEKPVVEAQEPEPRQGHTIIKVKYSEKVR